MKPFFLDKFTQLAALFFHVWGIILVLPIMYSLMGIVGYYFLVPYLLCVIGAAYPIWISHWKWYSKVLATLGNYFLLFFNCFRNLFIPNKQKQLALIG